MWQGGSDVSQSGGWMEGLYYGIAVKFNVKFTLRQLAVVWQLGWKGDFSK